MTSANEMNRFYISDISVRGLWGYKDIKFALFPDVNLIIGPNASGKTTIINLLNYSLTGNLQALGSIEFTDITIGLRGFDQNTKSSVKITRSKDAVEIGFGERKAKLPLPGKHSSDEFADLYTYAAIALRKHYSHDIFGLREELTQRVRAVWLPVSRRLPIVDEEDAERRRLHKKPLESVDECLSDLLGNLRIYRSSLDSQLAELRKEFQVHALETILYDKQHDKMPESHTIRPPDQIDKEQLLQAFYDVGFTDQSIKRRIDEHFSAAEKALKKLEKDGGVSDINSLFIFPLINRTRTMVEFARVLEQQRSQLFAALHLYEATVNSFLTRKRIVVDEDGDIAISQPITGGATRRLEWKNLSSGEKQILILLTQALLWEREPVVYVADEPELSLHVTWQEKLVGSLANLAGRCQFIIATHSPDVTGGFPQRIIDLGRI